MEKVILSKKWSLNLRDFAKSWVMLVGLPIVQTIIELVQTNGSFKGIEWNNIAISAITATILFLSQRFADTAKVITTYSDNEQAKSVAEKLK